MKRGRSLECQDSALDICVRLTDRWAICALFSPTPFGGVHKGDGLPAGRHPADVDVHVQRCGGKTTQLEFVGGEGVNSPLAGCIASTAAFAGQS